MPRPPAARRRCAGLALLFPLSLSWACAAAQEPPGDAEQAVAAQLPALYARYLAGGRSEVEIHLSAAGSYPGARGQPLADGRWRCQVQGLARLPVPLDTPQGALQLAAALVHESTHCLLGPHLAAARAAQAEESDAAALQWQLLSESLCDARALIEVFRRDGADAAQALLALMLPQRLAAASPAHATAPALRAAWERLQAQDLQDDAQAFDAALAVGLQQWPPAEEPEARQAAQEALQRARQAFRHGSLANAAFSLRQQPQRASAGDLHFFIDAQGSWRSEAALGAEGAHSLARLRQLLGAPPTLSLALARQWLQAQGQLEPAGLERTQALLGRFLAQQAGSEANSRERAATAVAQQMSQCRCGGELRAVLERAADELGGLQALQTTR